MTTIFDCLKRFHMTWAEHGFRVAFTLAWNARVRPLYQVRPHVPNHTFFKKGGVAGFNPPPHTLSVDIIVCVHDALDDVRRCLSSLVRHTRPPYQIILVDDGSSPPTCAFLAEWSRDQNARLIRNEQALGYTCAANLGLRASRAPFVVLLNSDTQVTPLWLDCMVACSESNSRIGMVGPLSNAASWQSVPIVLDAVGDWHENPLPESCSLRLWAALVGRESVRQYPPVPFLNGFCLLIKRAAIEEVGFFDEVNFGRGFGEENDYAIRLRKAGWGLALAEDAYVWHAQSKSYSHERRIRLSAEAQRRLDDLHGATVFAAGCGQYLSDLCLLGIRARVAFQWDRHLAVQAGMLRHEGRRVLFVLPTRDAGGGSHVVIQEAKAMASMGVDVRILNFSANQREFEAAYPEMTLPILYIGGPEDYRAILPRFDAVIATLFTSVKQIVHCETAPKKVAYYVQDYEPWFFEPGSPSYIEAKASYTASPELILITKTQWNRDVVAQETGASAHVVGPSVDTSLFRPLPGQGNSGCVHIGAMIRPQTPRRNAEFTLQVLAEAHRLHGEQMSITIFGCDRDDPLCNKFAKDIPFKHVGVLTRSDLAVIMPSFDVFLDLSQYQAMGLTALEAMASGVAVVVPLRGGANSFAIHEANSLVVDTNSHQECMQALKRLIVDTPLRNRLRQQAIFDAHRHFSEEAALKTLDAIFPQLESILKGDLK